ncbi:MAG TPA: ABC transporter permease [Patescibacteria group bacterium]|nr:ABC transporter permease [Patescibacteria group bacterium]
MGTIYIMWLRELKRFWRSKARIIGSLAQPVLFLVALGFGLGSTFQSAGDGNYIEFLAPGIIGMSILFSAMFMGIQVIWDRQFGFLKETLVAPVSRYKIMLGRTLGGATVASIQGLLVLIISMFIGFRPQNLVAVPLAFVFMFLIAVLFTALGTAIASRLEDMQGFQLIINFVIMPLFFLSGALFPLDNVPNVLKDIIRVNPLSYGIDGLRTVFTGVTHLGLILDFIVLASLTIIITLIGSYLFSRIEV